MQTTAIKITETPIILSRGIFDLLKDHLRRRKLSKYNEDKLELELRSAAQVLRKEIPAGTVTVDTKVTVKEVSTGDLFVHHLVAPAKAKRKHNTISILSPIGVAMLGYQEGAEIQWEMPEGLKIYRIEKVEAISQTA
ncbi:GreA/GreB family elongation factor [Pedobacter antarcticus]|uniref:GreA/GreB family elongation factor n=1 Tax=Pedobacter antarcticus TaxID=34086 RepID=UPI001C583F2E|nr:GreA/GreB family elongation factor [Pedobacter antarcticus]